jgi:hypothetical protein
LDTYPFLETLKHLPELVKLLQGLVESTIGAVVLAIYLLIYVFNKIPHLAVIQSWKKKKEERTKALEAYMTDEDADTSVKAIIRDQRDARHFELATGIHAEKKWRDGLVDLHTRSNATWLEMKRAWRYMDFDPSGALQIRKFTSWDKFDAGYNIAMAACLVIGAALVFILAASSAHGMMAPAPATSNVAPAQTTGTASALRANGTAALAGKAGTVTTVQNPVMTVLFWILFSFALFGSGIWAAAQNLPMKAAKKIQREAGAYKASAVTADAATATNAAAAAGPAVVVAAAAAPADVADVPVGAGDGAGTPEGSGHVRSAPPVTAS